MGTTRSSTLHICAVSVTKLQSHLIYIQFSIEHAKHLFMFPMGPCIAKNESFAKIPPKHKKNRGLFMGAAFE